MGLILWDTCTTHTHIAQINQERKIKYKTPRSCTNDPTPWQECSIVHSNINNNCLRCSHLQHPALDPDPANTALQDQGMAGVIERLLGRGKQDNLPSNKIIWEITFFSISFVILRDIHDNGVRSAHFRQPALKELRMKGVVEILVG